MKPIALLYLIFIVQGSIFLWTTIQPYTLNVEGRKYVIVRGHYLYSSYIRQSKDGAWNIINSHTTRPTPRVYTHLFFVFLGKIAALFQIEPTIMYMASRVVAAIILFWCTYWFIKLILHPSLHALALLFTLALEPGPLLTALTWNPSNWQAAIFSYYPQVVAYRHFGLPHHTMGEALGLVFLGMIILVFRKPSIKRLSLLGFVGIISTIILPPYPIILVLTVLVPWGIYSLFSKQWKKLIFPFLVSAIAIGIVGLFTKHEISKGYPMANFNLDEKRWVTNSDVILNYLSSLALYFPFVGFLWMSLGKLWRTWDSELKTTVLIMTSWVVLPPLIVPISSLQWFPLANFRIMDGYNFLPMGILATLGFSYLIKRIKKQSIKNFVSGFLISGLIVCSLLLTSLYTRQSISHQSGIWSNVYIWNGHYKAFAFLNTVPKYSGIMVMNHFGEIIPDFASVRTFIGSTPGFFNWGELFNIATTFFTGTLTDAQALTILKREDISYVYYSDEEKYYTTAASLYPNLLTPVFEAPGVTIFKVNK